MKLNNNNKIKSFDGVIKKDLVKIISTNHSQKDFWVAGAKMLGVTLVTLIFTLGLSRVGSTISYYRDVEKSISSFLQADPLSFKVTVDGETSVQLDYNGAFTDITPVMEPDEDSEPIQYYVKTKFVGGDMSLCESIHLQTTFPFPYDGPLLSLATATTTDVGAWTLHFTLNAIPKPDTSCVVDVIYKGWNAGSIEGRGYRDEKKVTVTLYVPEAEGKVESASIVAPLVEVEDVTPSAEDTVIPADVSQDVPPQIDLGGVNTPDTSADVPVPAVDVPIPSTDDIPPPSPEVITPTVEETPPEVEIPVETPSTSVESSTV